MNFEYYVTDEKFEEAKELIRRNGGAIYKDNSFTISGVTGYFSKSGRVLNIRITDKPWLASWGTIERKLNEFFN